MVDVSPHHPLHVLFTSRRFLAFNYSLSLTFFFFKEKGLVIWLVSFIYSLNILAAKFIMCRPSP